MSLINDALRDLDDRRKKEPAIDTLDAASTRKFNPKPMQLLTVILGMALCFCAGTFITNIGSDTRSPLGVMPTLGAAQAKTEASAEALAASVESESDQSVVEAVLVETPDAQINRAETVAMERTDTTLEKNIEVEGEQNEYVVSLMKKALVAFTLDHLTTPSEASAWFYFNRVLDIDPQNSAAERGIQKIQNRYTVLIESAYTKNDLVLAENLTRRLLSITPVEDRERVLDNIHIVKNQLALNSVQPERLGAAHTDIHVHTQHRNKVVLERSESNSRKSDLIEPDTFEPSVYERAQLMIEGGDDEVAIRFLASEPRQQEEVISLYAALLNKHKRYAESVVEYRTLVALDTSNYSYWLGLAVAEDATLNTRAALTAYKNVKVISSSVVTNPKLITFVNQRIKELEKNVSTYTNSDSVVELSQW